MYDYLSNGINLRNRFVRLTKQGTYGHIENCETESREWLGTLRRWALNNAITIGGQTRYLKDLDFDEELQRLLHPEGFYEDLEPSRPTPIGRNTPPSYSEAIKEDHPSLRTTELWVPEYRLEEDGWPSNEVIEAGSPPLSPGRTTFLRPSAPLTRKLMARDKRRKDRRERRVAD